MVAQARAWRKACEVPDGAFVGDQLALMRRFVNQEIDGITLVRGWFQARSSAMDAGERVCGNLENLLDDVFWVLEDQYVGDPELREGWEMADGELREYLEKMLRESGSGISPTTGSRDDGSPVRDGL